eukprot:COSAG03_NODE_3827_length_1811_cov_12.822513_1_plen_179_part_00
MAVASVWTDCRCCKRVLTGSLAAGVASRPLSARTIDTAAPPRRGHGSIHASAEIEPGTRPRSAEIGPSMAHPPLRQGCPSAHVLPSRAHRRTRRSRRRMTGFLTRSSGGGMCPSMQASTAILSVRGIGSDSRKSFQSRRFFPSMEGAPPVHIHSNQKVYENERADTRLTSCRPAGTIY